MEAKGSSSTASSSATQRVSSPTRDGLAVVAMGQQHQGHGPHGPGEQNGHGLKAKSKRPVAEEEDDPSPSLREDEQPMNDELLDGRLPSSSQEEEDEDEEMDEEETLRQQELVMAKLKSLLPQLQNRTELLLHKFFQFASYAEAQLDDPSELKFDKLRQAFLSLKLKLYREPPSGDGRDGGSQSPDGEATDQDKELREGLEDIFDFFRKKENARRRREERARAEAERLAAQKAAEAIEKARSESALAECLARIQDVRTEVDALKQTTAEIRTMVLRLYRITTAGFDSLTNSIAAAGLASSTAPSPSPTPIPDPLNPLNPRKRRAPPPPPITDSTPIPTPSPAPAPATGFQPSTPTSSFPLPPYGFQPNWNYYPSPQVSTTSTISTLTTLAAPPPSPSAASTASNPSSNSNHATPTSSSTVLSSTSSVSRSYSSSSSLASMFPWFQGFSKRHKGE